MVTENMFGDILTDEASMLAGSLGSYCPPHRSGRGTRRFVRAHSRLGTRYRRSRHRESLRHDFKRCIAAALLAETRERKPRPWKPPCRGGHLRCPARRYVPSPGVKPATVDAAGRAMRCSRRSNQSAAINDFCPRDLSARQAVPSAPHCVATPAPIPRQIGSTRSLGILDAHRHPQQARADAGPQDGQPRPCRHGSWWWDGRPGSRRRPEDSARVKHSSPVEEGFDRRLAACQFETQHGAETALLALRQFMPRMGGRPG